MITLDLNTDWAAGVTPVRADLREAVSDCYELTLDFIAANGAIPLSDALRLAATVTLSLEGQQRAIPGVVSEMSFMGSLPGDRFWYRLVLVPRLRLLELTRRSRVFCTDPPAPVAALLRQVIETAEGVSIPAADVSVNLQGTQYPVLDMAVQYGETDLAFLSRRAENAGIFYFFQTGGGSDQVVFGDANVCFPLLFGGPEASVLAYRPSVGVADRGMAVRALETTARLTTAAARLNTRDWTSPTRVLLVQSDAQAGGVGMHEAEEDDAYDDAGWGQALATIRAQELVAAASELSGRTDCMAMQAGYVFTLVGHENDALNGRYVITSVRHRMWESVAGIEFLPGDTPGGVGYANSFTALRLSVPFRPRRRTPQPRIDGLMRATVDGVSPARADVDDLGSYRLVLSFDRASRPPGRSSNRVRLVTPYGGSAEGFHFPLRPGTQVMVAFVKGNPDWPVIVGPLYDAGQMSVVTRANRYANVITTVSGITMKFYDGPPPTGS